MARPVASWSAGTGAKLLAVFRASRIVDTAPNAKADRSLDPEFEGG